MLHSVLSKLPQPLNLDALITQTIALFAKYPPPKLPGRTWSRISNNSVLKTTRVDFDKLTQQSLEDGERFFENEAAEIRRRDALLLRKRQLEAVARRYRRPATFTSLAVLVAVVAVLFRGYNAPLPVAGGWTSAMLGLQQSAADLWQRFTI